MLPKVKDIPHRAVPSVLFGCASSDSSQKYFYIILLFFFLWKVGFASDGEKYLRVDIGVTIKIILNITEIYDCVQNMDQLVLSCYLNFITGAIQIQTRAGTSMGQTARILLTTSTLLHPWLGWNNVLWVCIWYELRHYKLSLKAKSIFMTFLIKNVIK